MPQNERRRLRIATSAIYFQTGVVLAMWAVCIPQVRGNLGVSPAVLGTLLLMLGAGLIAGIQVGGPVLDRLGSRRICGVGVAVFAAAINLPGLADGPVSLAMALFALGLGCGLTDIAITDQAVRVERAYGRSIMSNIHGFYSVGAALGAGLGAALQSVHAGLKIELLSAAVVAAATGLLAVPRLQAGVWSGTQAGPAQAGDSPSEPGRTADTHRYTPTSTIAVLAALVLIFMLVEGVANDWSALEAIEQYGVSKPSASLAFVTFTAAMTAGRLTMDHVVRRVGPTAVLRTGGSLATIALVLILWAPVFWLATIGWAVFGVAIAGLLPQMFTALGDVRSAKRGRTVSRVVGIGYIGLLAGPSVIGWLSHLVGLRYALVLPAVLCLISVGLAHRVTGNGANHRRRNSTTTTYLEPEVLGQQPGLAPVDGAAAGRTGDLVHE